MRICRFDTAAQVGRAAATLITAQLLRKPDSVLGLATGSTPVPTYEELIALYKAGVVDFSKVRSFNLDEYCNLPVDHEQSYHSFMKENLFDHINIDINNTRVPDGNGGYTGWFAGETEVGAETAKAGFDASSVTITVTGYQKN